MKWMFLKKRLCLMMVMILAIVTVFMGKPMTAKAAEQVTVNYDFNEVSDVCINDEYNHVFPGGRVNGNATSNTNRIILCTSPSKHFQTIKINGTDYPVNGSNTTTIPGPGNAQKVTLNDVPASPTYNIEVTTTSSGFDSILWAYDANSPSDNSYITCNSIGVLKTIAFDLDSLYTASKLVLVKSTSYNTIV